jgi:hypothetical protein
MTISAHLGDAFEMLERWIAIIATREGHGT